MHIKSARLVAHDLELCWHDGEDTPAVTTISGDVRPEPQIRVEQLESEEESDTQAVLLFERQVPIPIGLTVVMGAAGTGKSTTLRSMMQQAKDAGFATIALHVNEPDYDDDIGTHGWHRALLYAVYQASVTKNSVLVIDSLRHLTTISTGYPGRLGASGFDLTTLQALSDIDRCARRLRVRVIGSLFLSSYQITKGDLGNDELQRRILRTLAADIDGCVATTVLMGPLRREAGEYTATSRAQREQVWTGKVVLANAAPDPTVIGDRTLTSLPLFAGVRSSARAEAVVFAERQAHATTRGSYRAPKKSTINDNPESMPSDPAALVDQMNARQKFERDYLAK